MERDVTLDLYLTISKKGLEKTKKKASDKGKEEFGDDGKDDLYYPDCTWECEEVYFDKEEQSLMASGEFSSYGEKIGYLSPKIKFSNDTIVEIIEHYMKKMAKLKTVLEATK